MEHLRKFFSSTKMITLRNRVEMQQVCRRKKTAKLDLPLEVCCYNLFKAPKRLNSNLPVFKIYQCNNNNLFGTRFFTASNNNLDVSQYMISTFEVKTGLQPFKVATIGLQSFMIRLFYDQSFKLKEFEEAAGNAIKVVSKLISEKRLSELEDLVTPECLSKLSTCIDNWVPSHREDIAVKDSDLYSLLTYNLDLREEDNRKAFEVTSFMIIMKDLGNKIKRSDMEENFFGSMKMIEESITSATKIYGANYRFLKWVDKDGSSDWTISGVNHFRLPNMKVP